MATIRKRGNSYQIRVFCGYDTSGNQVEQTFFPLNEKKQTIFLTENRLFFTNQFIKLLSL